MMFMMPMPPTTSEMMATAESSEVIVAVTSCWLARTSVLLRIQKSSLSGNGGWRRCRLRR